MLSQTGLQTSGWHHVRRHVEFLSVVAALWASFVQLLFSLGRIRKCHQSFRECNHNFKHSLMPFQAHFYSWDSSGRHLENRDAAKFHRAGTRSWIEPTLGYRCFRVHIVHCTFVFTLRILFSNASRHRNLASQRHPTLPWQQADFRNQPPGQKRTRSGICRFNSLLSDRGAPDRLRVSMRRFALARPPSPVGHWKLSREMKSGCFAEPSKEKRPLK